MPILPHPGRNVLMAIEYMDHLKEKMYSELGISAERMGRMMASQPIQLMWAAPECGTFHRKVVAQPVVFEMTAKLFGDGYIKSMVVPELLPVLIN
jgi:hypothetical protein